MVILKLIGYLVNSGLNTWNWGKFVSSRVVGDCKWLNVLCIGCKADWVCLQRLWSEIVCGLTASMFVGFVQVYRGLQMKY